MLPNSTTRVCKRCGETKPLTDFYEMRGCVDGRRPACKVCVNLTWNAWRAANPERIKQTCARYYQNNKTRLLPKNREAGLKSRYGLPFGSYDRMFDTQGGKCAICDEPHTRGKLVVDHEHETGKVRGLLCYRCNNAIGFLGESHERIMRVIDYLSAPPYQLESCTSTREGTGLV